MGCQSRRNDLPQFKHKTPRFPKEAGRFCYLPGQQGAVPFGQQGVVPLAQQGAVWAIAVAIEAAKARPSAQVAMSFCMGSILLLVALPTNQPAARDKKKSVFAHLSKHGSPLHNAEPHSHQERATRQRRARRWHRRAGSLLKPTSTFAVQGKAPQEPTKARPDSLCGNTRGPSPSYSAKTPFDKPATAKARNTPPIPRAVPCRTAEPSALDTRAIAKSWRGV